MSAARESVLPIVRAMTHDDISAVSSIERESYRFPWSTGIFRDCILAGYQCLVLEHDGQIRAYAILSVAAGEAHILNICVAPSFRRRGCALRLIRTLMLEARRARVEQLFLEVRPSNRAAIRLYRGLGFVTVGRRRDYYKADNDSREDALVLSLML